MIGERGRKTYTMKSLTRIATVTLLAFATAGCLESEEPDIQGEITPTPPPSDTTPPSITGTNPANGASSVGMSSNIVVNFSESIDVNSVQSGDIRVTVSGQDSVSGSISSTPNSITFTPDQVLDAQTSYTVEVGPNIADLAGNTMSSAYMFGFETESDSGGSDTTPPQVVSTTPDENSVSVAVSTTISIIFSESIAAASVQSSDVTVSDSQGADVSGTVSVSGNTVTFSPDNALANSTVYSVSVGPGINDMAGNAMDSPFVFDFETEADSGGDDTTPPQVASTTPVDNSTSIATSTNISIVFDQSISAASVQQSDITVSDSQGGSVSGTVSASDDTITFSPNNALANSTTYSVSVGPAIDDLAGNSMTAAFDFSFTTISASSSDVPLLSQWEANMVTYGESWGQYVNPNGGVGRSNRIDAIYYDGQYTFYQIADYTGDAEPWNTYADYAGRTYREYLGNSFDASGYWRFPHGIYQDFARGDGATIQDVRRMRDNPAFSNVYEFGPNTGYFGEWESISRELAYVIQANVIAERAGEPRRMESGNPRLMTFVGYTESQLNEWRTQTFANPGGGRFAPFMFGLTAHALIEFYEWEVENGRDPNAYWPGEYWPTIQDALEDVADWAFNSATVRAGSRAGQRMWVDRSSQDLTYGAFRYDDTAGGSGDIAYDLNMLIAPTYAWLYKQTGETRFRDMGDALWTGGVRSACIECLGKIYHQNYRMSFDYLRWRNSR